MNYQETLNFLFTQIPVFENIGSGAYKPGLGNIEFMDEYFGHPHRKFKTIHVAGTNGKGSTSHTLAAILQSAGLRVGLFTSPHLLDFNERIRVNGTPIEHDYVVKWVADHYDKLSQCKPSFFELATMMGFCYFADQQVDVAVIEVGLGGRLDSTNIITPILSIITNISYDHMQFLGNTLPEIAAEKAGIMKAGVPCVVGESGENDVRQVFIDHAKILKAPLTLAEEENQILFYKHVENVQAPDGAYIEYGTLADGKIFGELTGLCQVKNTNTILNAIHLLSRNFIIRQADIIQGFAHVSEMTGLMGRWQKIAEHPETYCDTGHNEGGFKYIASQLNKLIGQDRKLHIVFGMVRDKDIDAVLCQLPQEAIYYFTNASTPRALPADDMMKLTAKYKLNGTCHPHIEEALEMAQKAASAEPNGSGFVYVGGSTFVVAEAMKAIQAQQEKA